MNVRSSRLEFGDAEKVAEAEQLIDFCTVSAVISA